MKIRTHSVDGVEVVEPRGKLLGGEDTGELDQRHYSLLGRDVTSVVVDLVHTDWMNSSGLAILLHHYKKFRDKGGNLVLANLTNKIERILVISRLALVFQSFDSVDEAVGSFKK
jgi:anti-anti-sigma factor